MKTATLEVIGMVCPFPLLEAKDALAVLNPGDELTIHFDCTQASESIPRWATENGHVITNFEQLDVATWTITVKKSS